MASHLINRCKSRPAKPADYLKYVALLYLFTSPAMACDLPSWQATYDITKWGSTIARLNMSLQAGNGQAQYRLHTEAVGLIAAITDEELTETSQLKQNENKSWQLENFSQQRAEDKQRYQKFSLTTDGDKLRVQGEHDGKPFRLTASAPVWDRSSVQIALTCDLLGGNKPLPAYDYTIIDGGNINQYHLEFRGQEIIRIADKKFDTLKFERISGDRSTLFWLAPALQYMTVRMEQYKKGDIHLRMNLDIPVAE